MITFITLLLALLVISVIGVFLVALGASAFIVVFGDVIVFFVIMYLIIKLIKNRKEK